MFYYIFKTSLKWEDVKWGKILSADQDSFQFHLYVNISVDNCTLIMDQVCKLNYNSYLLHFLAICKQVEIHVWWTFTSSENPVLSAHIEIEDKYSTCRESQHNWLYYRGIKYIHVPVNKITRHFLQFECCHYLHFRFLQFDFEYYHYFCVIFSTVQVCL